MRAITPASVVFPTPPFPEIAIFIGVSYQDLLRLRFLFLTLANHTQKIIKCLSVVIDEGKKCRIPRIFSSFDKAVLIINNGSLKKEHGMKMNKKALALLSAGHLTTDINQGALPALLPFFKEALNLSYTMSGAIMLSANIASSIIQPAFGYLSDRRPMKWLLPVAPLIACLGLSMTGFVSTYPLLLLCVIVTGCGIAGFHPDGFKTAYFFTGD